MNLADVVPGRVVELLVLVNGFPTSESISALQVRMLISAAAGVPKREFGHEYLISSGSPTKEVNSWH
jgi:hypothetical protein